MERELKFRAFIDGKMIYSHSCEGELSHQKFANFFLTLLNTSECKNVMQFTGVKDREGIDIYEGDIVECDWNINKQYNPYKKSENIHDTQADPIIQKCTVYYTGHYAGFSVSTDVNISEKKYSSITGLTKYRAETFLTVIGNIYENTEIL